MPDGTGEDDAVGWLAGVRFLVVADGRRRWRSAALVAVVVAVAMGVPAAALAAGRRTETAYGRFLERADAVDVAVATPAPDLQAPDRIAGVPGVAEAHSYVGLFSTVERARDDLAPEVLGSLDGLHFGVDRPAVLEGRMPRRSSRDEVVVSHDAPADMRPGARVRLRFVAGGERELGVGTVASEGEMTRSFTVVGRVRFPFAVLSDEIDSDGAGRILLTPAATAELIGFTYYLWTGVVLDGTTTLAEFTAAVDEVGGDVPTTVQTAAGVRTRVERAVRPQVVALTVLAAVLAAGAVVVLVTGTGRMVDPRRESRVLAALGLPRPARGLVGAAVPAAGVVAGSAGAVGVAVALSPLGPVGEMRDVEPDPGVTFDAAAVLGVVGGLTVVVVACLAAIAWRIAGAGPVTRPAGARRGPLGVAGRLPLPLAVGARMAIEDEAGRISPTSVAMVAGNVSAVAAVTAAAVFGANLGALVDHPARFGWDWDVFVSAGGGYGQFDPAGVDEVAGSDGDVSGWSVVGFGQVEVGDRSVPAIGLEAGAGDVRPPVAHGAPVRAADELVVGAVTLRQLGLTVGDTVEVGASGERRTFRIVGSGPLPTLGTVQTDHASLGVGMLFDLDALKTVAAPGTTGPGTVQPSGLLVRTRDGARPDTVADRLLAQADRLSPVPQDLYVRPPILAADIRNYEEMGGQPLVIAAALVLLAAGALLVTMRSVIRRRRRDLAVLVALGLTPAQLRRVVFGHATTTLAVALCLGLVLGIAAGRAAWTAYAERMGVLPDATVPLAPLGVVALGLIGVTYTVTALPALWATRISTTDALRAETPA